MKESSVASGRHAKFRVTILSSNPARRGELQQILETHQLQVMDNLPLTAAVVAALDLRAVDIILLDLDEDLDDDLDLVDGLMKSSRIPVLFNDVATTQFLQSEQANRRWGKSLVNKLAQLVASNAALDAAEPDSTAASAPPPATRPAKVPTIWVLGASLGGPIACREFFRHLDPDLPVSFLLAQHIGASHVDLLAQQLNRVAPLQVIPAAAGTRLRAGVAMIAPVEQRISFNAEQRLQFAERDPKCIYTPCIDQVIEETIAAFGNAVSVIIFSGMGNDGEKGCRYAAQNNCMVWAQDSESCVISSMPDRARASGAVSFNGTPQQLAHQLSQLYRI